MGCSWLTRLAAPLLVSQLSHIVSAQDDNLLSSVVGGVSSVASEATSVLPTTVPSVLSSLSSVTSGTPTGTDSAPTVSATSSDDGPKVHLVKAGSGSFRFEPQELTDVKVGDIITFEFYPPDHSVARAEFGSPCVPYEYTGRNKTGFWSDIQWVETVEDITHWNLTINSTEPIFYYCAAPGSCIDKLMVGAINPNTTQTLEKQIEEAGKSDYQVKPGDPIPMEGSATLHTPEATSSTTAGSSGGSHSPKLSAGAIAGIVVGGVVFLVVCAALFFYVGRTKSLKDMVNRKDATVAKPTGVEQQFPPSPGYPFSPNQHQDGFPPQYGQHNATDANPSGWPSPTMHQGHTSMMSQMSQPASEVKYSHTSQTVPAEMASPRQTYTAELEAPPAHKAPH